MWPEDWAKQMEKMNESVGDKNRLDNSGGRKQLVCHFTNNKFWKFIGCILSSVTYGMKGHNIWRKNQTYVGNIII